MISTRKVINQKRNLSIIFVLIFILSSAHLKVVYCGGLYFCAVIPNKSPYQNQRIFVFDKRFLKLILSMQNSYSKYKKNVRSYVSVKLCLIALNLFEFEFEFVYFLIELYLQYSFNFLIYWLIV